MRWKPGNGRKQRGGKPMKKMSPIPLSGVRLTEGLAARMQALVRDKVLPYQWEILNDRVEGAAKSHCVENFRIAAGLDSGQWICFE